MSDDTGDKPGTYRAFVELIAAWAEVMGCSLGDAADFLERVTADGKRVDELRKMAQAATCGRRRAQRVHHRHPAHPIPA